MYRVYELDTEFISVTHIRLLIQIAQESRGSKVSIFFFKVRK